MKKQTMERYDIVSAYINNQTESEWKRLVARVISQLDFETRLAMSKDIY